MTIRRTKTILGLALLLCLFGCGGSGESTDHGHEHDGDHAGHDHPPTTQPTRTQSAPPSPGGDDDLMKQWGPDDMPDSSQEPLEFLYWRVDRMYEKEDLDGDGRLTLDEYSGDVHNFERIDSNGDGFMTKKETIDDYSAVLREQGRIP